MLRDLAPLLGRRFSCAVVPDWHDAWPLAAHRDYCRLVRDGAEELLLHGYTHRRRRGRGATTLLTGGNDELNGLDAAETRSTIERGQHIFSEIFEEHARGFIAPTWQRGSMRLGDKSTPGLEFILGFFSLDFQGGRSVPLATWMWDCGRWRHLGHLGHALGWLAQSLDRGIPTLALHPSDLGRGYWRPILRLIRALLADGYEPSTVARLREVNGW
jgi:peptidoglycan/xylan/chitin deacetylase (PgdA/CDA1 family)